MMFNRVVSLFMCNMLFLTSTAQVRKEFQIDLSKYLNTSFRLVIVNTSDSLQPVSFYFKEKETDYSTVGKIVASLVEPKMTEKEKVIAIWTWTALHISYCIPEFYKPAETVERWYHQPAILFWVLGCGYCDDASAAFLNLCLEAGLEARIIHLNGHLVTEVYFQGDWHMFDASRGLYYQKDGEILNANEVSLLSHLLTDRNRVFVKTPSRLVEKIRVRKDLLLFSSQTDNYENTEYYVNKTDYSHFYTLGYLDTLILDFKHERGKYATYGRISSRISLDQDSNTVSNEINITSPVSTWVNGATVRYPGNWLNGLTGVFNQEFSFTLLPCEKKSLFPSLSTPYYLNGYTLSFTPFYKDVSAGDVFVTLFIQTSSTPFQKMIEKNEFFIKPVSEKGQSLSYSIAPID